jgi:predicted esterase
MSNVTRADTPTPRWRGVNHNIYSQSTWTSGDPSPGTNYRRSDHRTVDYFHAKGVNHLRMMFTWEWVQPTLLASIPGPEPFLSYWGDLLDTVDYATGLGMQVNLAHYGFAPNFWPDGSGNTTPSWKGVGTADGVSYSNRVGGPAVPNAAFDDLWTRLATTFLSNPLVSFGLLNEPHDMDTLAWFGTAQSAITAIRSTGSTAWIHVPGNGYAGYDVHSASSDTAPVKRSNAEGWANANGPGSPLSDPLDKLVAECHIYVDDSGGSTLAINGYNGGTTTDAARDRLAVMVDWARPLGHRVHVGEIGFYGGTPGAQATWDAFVAYCADNSDVITGYDWWGASEPGWWQDVGTTHFSVTPTTAGDQYSGDTINMDMIETAFAPAPLYLPVTLDANGFFHLDSGQSHYVGYRPDTYSQATPSPLFVWLHGCGGQAEGDLWTIAPPATRASQSYLAISLGGRDGECWQVDLDGPKLLAAVKDVQRYLNVDVHRIYVGGYSSGGDMAYRHGFENAGTFAGILVENSDPFRDTGSTAAALMAAAAWKINVGHVAHLSDATYPIATVRSSFATLSANGFPATLVEKPGTHFDPDSGTTGTNYDLIHSLLPFLGLGWRAPDPA